MPTVNYFGSGPQTFGPGITWSSAYGYSVFGYTGGYGFAGNGYWQNDMAGTNDSSSTMRFDLTTPVTAIGGFINYAPGYGTPQIAVYDTASNLIESYTPTFSTGGGFNTGQFLGFSESTPIGSFQLSGAYIGITDLTLGQATATPEPGTFGLLAGALAGVAALVRRRRA